MLEPPRAGQLPAPGLSGNLVVQTSLGGDIYVVDMATGSSRYLVSGIDPSISPDGKNVAFTRDGGDHGLFLIGIDGGNERRIYSGGERLRAPTWSPDGAYVLFNRLSGEFECRDVGFGICLPDNPFLSSFDLTTQPEYGLSRVNADGGEFRDLPTLTSAKAPSWSEGGITYQSNTGLEVTNDDPDGTTRLLLSAPYYQDPDWQPGKDRIVFQSREGSHWEIFSVVQDGSGLYALTKPVTTLVDELAEQRLSCVESGWPAYRLFEQPGRREQRGRVAAVGDERGRQRAEAAGDRLAAGLHVRGGTGCGLGHDTGELTAFE